MKNKIEFQWDERELGPFVLLAKKKKGKITVEELTEALSDDERYFGGWAIIIKAREEYGYQGWGDFEEPKGDVLELYKVDEWETCPICAEVYEGIEDCPHCGKKLRAEA